MGIPTLFRWLKDRYPKMLSSMAAAPSIDNFYIDMNGMIHPCFHPEGRPAPKNLNEVFQEIFIYLDKVVELVNPNDLLYLAIDGPAPRAKLNQQRMRRFNAAYESQLKDKLNVGAQKPVEQIENEDIEKLDSNVITPGTPFMQQLSVAIKQWISSRQSDKLAHLTIIFSDAQTPGEGEHKIMKFIRAQRQQLNYKQSTTHCVHGLDADHIMLGLASHEPGFYIFREVVFVAKDELVCTCCGSVIKRDSTHDVKCPNVEDDSKQFPVVQSKAFQFLSISLFREYLLKEFQCNKEHFERVLDDFVFLCFLSGNDFLPHAAAMRISDNALIRIIDAYKSIYGGKGVFITNSGEVNVQNFLPFLRYFAQFERSILVVQEQQDTKRAVYFKQESIRQLEEQIQQCSDQITIGQLRNKLEQMKTMSDIEVQSAERNEYFRNVQIADDDCTTLAVEYVSEPFAATDPRWRKLYYKNKTPAEIMEMCHQYLKGMHWVCLYYCKEVADWSYYYPYYEPPLLQDLTYYIENNAAKCSTITFPEKTMPFSPFEQLLAVLPPHSCEALPKPLQRLMMDKHSPLVGFYPNRFRIDISGKSQLYQGTIILPFIDETVLRAAYKQHEAELTLEEVERNTFRDCQVYANANTKMGCFLQQVIDDKSLPDDYCKKITLKDQRHLYYITNCEKQTAGFYSQSKVEFFPILAKFVPCFNTLMYDQICKNQAFTEVYPNLKLNQRYTNQTLTTRFVDPLFKQPFINYIQNSAAFEQQLNPDEWERARQQRDRKRDDAWRGLHQEEAVQNVTKREGQIFVPGNNAYMDPRYGSGVGRFVPK